jgi:hypothetical protein
VVCPFFSKHMDRNARDHWYIGPSNIVRLHIDISSIFDDWCTASSNIIWLLVGVPSTSSVANFAIRTVLWPWSCRWRGRVWGRGTADRIVFRTENVPISWSAMGIGSSTCAWAPLNSPYIVSGVERLPRFVPCVSRELP